MDGELFYNQRQNIQHLEELDLRLAFSKQYTHQKNSENLRLNFGHENLQDLCHLKVLWLCGNNLINSPKLPGSLVQLYCRGNDFSTREHSLFDENTSYEHLEEVVLNFTKLSPSTRIPNGQALKRLHLYESTLPNEELLLDVLPTLHKDCSIRYHLYIRQANLFYKSYPMTYDIKNLSKESMRTSPKRQKLGVRLLGTRRVYRRK